MSEDILDAALRLRQAGEPFVIATVTRAEKPTSAKPGAKAIITAAGEWIGWIGGSCSRPSVEYEARRALESGKPHLVQLSSTETCASGGSLDIFLEPHVPKPHLIVVGHLPLAEALVNLAKPLGFRVTAMTPEGTPEQFAAADAFLDQLDFEDLGPGARYVVVASHGNYDEEAIEGASKAEADYVALVASKKRASALGVPDDVKCPAGLDIGAVTPEEIALSILAENRFRPQGRGSTSGAGCGQRSNLWDDGRNRRCALHSHARGRHVLFLRRWLQGRIRAEAC